MLVSNTKILKHLEQTVYTLNNKKHREDGPAVESPILKEWWINGELHREDGPARMCSGGSVYYYSRGKLHREDGPAIILSNGLSEWWWNGKRHRADGPAYIFKNTLQWWKDGKLHRTDGPAIFDGIKSEWYENGERHRTDGPAIVYHLAEKKVWYINDDKYDTEQEFNYVIRTLKKQVVDNLYNTKKVCKDIAIYISGFVY